MKVIDSLNNKFGGFMIKIANQDLDRTWKMKQDHLSPQYTSRISDIIQVNCEDKKDKITLVRVNKSSDKDYEYIQDGISAGFPSLVGNLLIMRILIFLQWYVVTHRFMLG